MKDPILVVLAAGMGSRYGGLKQIDPIGASGEVLLDYSVFDALRAGFGSAVFIIRRSLERDFTGRVLSRMKGAVPYALAFQELDSLIPPGSLPPGREKPWGTCHALLCAEPCIDAPFAVINADDFYGRPAYEAMAAFLRAGGPDGALVPYRLERTLSPAGSVTRGVCALRGGFLASVDELTRIERKGGVITNTAENGEVTALPPDTPVSMNFWGFPLSVFPPLRAYFAEFLASRGAELKSECYIPLAAARLIQNGSLAVRALEADSEWFGVTYGSDRAAASARIARLTAEGVYPARLWQ